MSTIVGLVTETGVVVGGDTQATINNHKENHPLTPKVFKRGDFIFGCAGNYRDQQLISILPMPKIPWRGKNPTRETVFKYLLEQWVPVLRESLQKNGRLLKDEDGTESSDCLEIVAYGDYLFTRESNFSVLSFEEYVAIGTGQSWAIGSLYTSHNYAITDGERMIVALNAAAANDVYTSSPYTILSTGEPW